MLLVNNRTIIKPAKIKVELTVQFIKYKNITIDLDLDDLPFEFEPGYQKVYNFIDIADYAAEKLSAMNPSKRDHDMMTVKDAQIIDFPNDIEWYE